MAIHILLVDDHAVVRQGLKMFLGLIEPRDHEKKTRRSHPPD
jgi:DNA-binding NarL/FixJ family response regulator